MQLTLESIVGDLVVERPGRIPLLESLGIDYCCGGGRTIAEASRAAGREPGAVLEALRDADASIPADAAADWSGRSLGDLIDHIVSRHHEYLRRQLPVLATLAGKVLAAHGKRHPELEKIRSRFDALRGELESHLAKEEHVLFPMIREMEEGERVTAGHCGSVGNPIRVMEMEHDAAGAALRDLRSWTNAYTPPEDGCTSYRALLAGLAALERDLHEHIHMENNLLHPRAAALEASLCDGARS